jgi:hypothetical protein
MLLHNLAIIQQVVQHLTNMFLIIIPTNGEGT